MTQLGCDLKSIASYTKTHFFLFNYILYYIIFIIIFKYLYNKLNINITITSLFIIEEKIRIFRIMRV